MSNGCPGQGQGKVCKAEGTQMARMTDYMTYLFKKIGYESLKMKHLKSFPALGKKSTAGDMDVLKKRKKILSKIKKLLA